MEGEIHNKYGGVSVGGVVGGFGYSLTPACTE